MPLPQTLRAQARTMFNAAVAAADPNKAVRQALQAQPIAQPKGKLILIAFGKAAVPMLAETMRHAPAGAKVVALAVTNYENEKPLEGATVLAAGHPVPDENGHTAARLVAQICEDADAQDVVLFLVSGGGSALLPCPARGISLVDKICVNELLLAGGFDILDTNLVRQQLSALKGGGLARLTAPAPQRSLVISDVIGNDPRVIASGPTAAPIGTRSDAQSLLRNAGVWNALPPSVQAHLEAAGDTPKCTFGHLEVIASNRQSLEAMKHAAPCPAEIINDRLAGDVAEAAAEIVATIQTRDPAEPTALIWGGETTVTLTGSGKGGRNQELALRVAQGLTGMPDNWVFLSGGTDGRDGPTDAAGGVVDGGTLARMGMPVETILAANDSYHGLAAAEDLLMSGATGTNVADVQVFLRG